MPRSYGDDWWFTAHHGMALSENGQYAAARPKIDRSLAQNPANPWAAHASAHLCYEEGDPEAARAFLASWLTTYPRNGALYSHLSWHLALGHLEAGDPAAASRLFREAFAPEVHSGPPRGKLNDAVSFLWRWELAGHPRDAAAWRMMHDFVNGAFPRAGGSHAQLDLVRFTLLKAYLYADRPDDARRMLSVRRPRPSAIPIAGLAAVH